MSELAQKEKNFHVGGVHYIHYIITTFFCLVVPMFPPIAPLTETGMCLVGVLIGAVYGWSTIGSIFTSIVALFGLALVLGVNQMMSMAFGNFLMLFLILCMPAMSVLTTTGAMDWLVTKVLTNKLTLGKPWLTITVILFSAMFLGIINALIVLLLYMQFVRSLSKSLDIAPYSKLVTFLFLGFALATSLAQCMLPFMGQPLVLIVTYSNISGGQMLNFAKYLMITVPTSICVMLTFIACMRFVFRVDVSQLANIKPEMLGESGKMTRDQGIALAILALWMVMLLASVVDFFGPLYTFFSKLGLLGVTMILVIALMLIKNENGSGPLLDFRAGARDFSWDTLLLTAVIMVLSSTMSNPETGVSAAMSMLLAPFNALPPLFFIILILLTAGLVTNVANNMVVAVVVMPFIYNYAVMNNIDPSGYITLLFMVANMAIATPGASAGAGICFAQSDMVKVGPMIKLAVPMIIILLIVAIAVGSLITFAIY